jgi:hypothetical protein
MHRRSVIALLTFIIIGTVAGPLPAGAVNKIWYGYVVHVSTNNIKVIDTDGAQTQSFLILPQFKEVFSSDGKTTYQMAQIKRNMLVKVYYDRNLSGQTHADKIYVLNEAGQVQHASS